MAPVDPRLTIARRLVRAGGVVLGLLGLAHLAATPHIPALIGGLRGTPDYAWALGPTLLNHVLVGLLLLPLGLSTWIAADGAHIGQGWARGLLAANTLAVLALPVSLVVFMRGGAYYSSPLFVTGVGLVAVASLLMALAVGWLLTRRAG